MGRPPRDRKNLWRRRRRSGVRARGRAGGREREGEREVSEGAGGHRMFQEQRRLTAKANLANNFVSKLDNAKNVLALTLCKPQTVNCPAMVVTPAKTCFEKIEGYLAICKRIAADPKSSDFPWDDSKEVSAVCGEAKKADTLLNSMVKALGRL